MKLFRGLHTLAEVHPELIEEFMSEKNDPLTPDGLATGSGKKVWWKCKECGREWCTTVNSRCNLHTGCKVCSANKIAPLLSQRMKEFYSKEQSYNYRLTDYMLLLRKENPILLFRCPECGYTWHSRLNRQRKNKVCPNCEEQKHLELLRGCTVNETLKREK